MSTRDWNAAITAVLQLLQTDPPSRTGEAVFTQKIRNLYREINHENHRSEPDIDTL